MHVQVDSRELLKPLPHAVIEGKIERWLPHFDFKGELLVHQYAGTHSEEAFERVKLGSEQEEENLKNEHWKGGLTVRRTLAIIVDAWSIELLRIKLLINSINLFHSNQNNHSTILDKSPSSKRISWIQKYKWSFEPWGYRNHTKENETWLKGRVLDT